MPGSILFSQPPHAVLVQTSDGKNIRLTNVGPVQTSDHYKRQTGTHVGPVQTSDGYIYKEKRNKTYYQCIQRKNNSCSAGAVVNNENDKIITFLGEHTHDSDLLKKRVQQRVAKI